MHIWKVYHTDVIKTIQNGAVFLWKIIEFIGIRICWWTNIPLYSAIITAWKVSKYGFFSGPFFPVFGLNAENYGVNLRIQCEYRKTRTRKNSVFGHFSRSVYNPIFHLISPHFIFATTSCFRCHQNKWQGL